MDARRFLDEAGKQQVADAVQRAESRTAVEVVCLVATESGRYDRAEAIVGVVFSLIGLSMAWTGSGIVGPAGQWSAPSSLGVLVAATTVGSLLGNVVGSYVHAIRRALVSEHEMAFEVERGAAAAFTHLHVAHTSRRSGVLVYVSIFERRVVVLLDDGTQAAAPDGFAKTLCDQAIAGLRAGQRAEALVKLIDVVADTFAPSLPPIAGRPNELRDAVVVLHPR